MDLSLLRGVTVIKSFEINGYRRHKKTKFNNLSRINIILGSNNSGKTSILESIFGFCAGENLQPLIFNSILRYKDQLNKFNYMEAVLGAFSDPNVKPMAFSFKAEMTNGETPSFEHTFFPNLQFADLKPKLMGTFGFTEANFEVKQNEIPFIPIGKWATHINGKTGKTQEFFYPPNFTSKNPYRMARFIDILSHRDQQENTKIFGFLKREQVFDEFSEELRKTFPHIKGIDMIPYPDGSPSMVNFLTDKGLLPIYTFGDGVQRWYNILGGLIVYQNSILCIEEVDATFHPEAQKDLSINLYKYTQKYNNQVFMTSHSIEFIDNLLDAIYGNGSNIAEDCIRIITLKNDPSINEVKVRVLTGEEAYLSREKYQLELR